MKYYIFGLVSSMIFMFLFLVNGCTSKVATSFHHKNAPYIFLVSNYNKLRDEGDRRDITPTILGMFGFELGTIKPPLDGKSLLIK